MKISSSWTLSSARSVSSRTVYTTWYTVLTCGYFEVNAVAVVCVAAVDVEQALCTETVERLSRGHKVVPCYADTDALLLAFDEGSGGHAGPISLTLEAIPLTLRSGAVTPQSCRDESGRRINTVWNKVVWYKLEMHFHIFEKLKTEFSVTLA